MDYKNLATWYKGKCHAPGILVEEESEIMDSTQCTVIADEEADLELAYDELETIKRRLITLRGKLLIRSQSCEEEIPYQLEDATFLTQNQQHLMQLRRSNCVLKCQLRKLLQHLHATRSQMKVLEATRCQLNSRLTHMTEELTKFEAFKLKAMDYFGHCIERNEQIKSCKVNNEDFALKMKAMIYHTESRMRHLVPMRCHHQLHYDLSVELVLIRIFLQSLFSNMIDDWNQCKRRLIHYNWRCSAILPPSDIFKGRD
ncbi:uncharacterized protein LOC117784026 [Drosophila innubila]|uniref:uncharacterized protein LOC117784026 n=1 Tax=Drosophila innubila TaxID=198719 RepID=UPI00148E44E9|nr:uncharacterized protein LOC117784026 [Drosophila innubila]